MSTVGPVWRTPRSWSQPAGTRRASWSSLRRSWGSSSRELRGWTGAPMSSNNWWRLAGICTSCVLTSVNINFVFIEQMLWRTSLSFTSIVAYRMALLYVISHMDLPRISQWPTLLWDMTSQTLVKSAKQLRTLFFTISRRGLGNAVWTFSSISSLFQRFSS